MMSTWPAYVGLSIGAAAFCFKQACIAYAEHEERKAARVLREQKRDMREVYWV